MLSTRLAETIKKLGLMPGINTMEEAKLETTGGKTNLAREKVSERLCPTLASRTGSRKVSVVFPRPSSKTGHNGGKTEAENLRRSKTERRRKRLEVERGPPVLPRPPRGERKEEKRMF